MCIDCNSCQYLNSTNIYYYSVLEAKVPNFSPIFLAIHTVVVLWYKLLTSHALSVTPTYTSSCSVRYLMITSYTYSTHLAITLISKYMQLIPCREECWKLGGPPYTEHGRCTFDDNLMYLCTLSSVTTLLLSSKV